MVKLNIGQGLVSSASSQPKVCWHLNERGASELLRSMPDHWVGHFMTKNHLGQSISFLIKKIIKTIWFSPQAGHRFYRSQAFPWRQRCSHLEEQKHSLSAANGKNEISPCERKSFHLIDNGHCPLFVVDLSKIPVAHKEFVWHRGNPVGIINDLRFTIYNF